MPGPHVPHDARPQIQGITLAHDRSPDHGESSIAAPVTPPDSIFKHDALARKLAVILHRMWVDGTTFRWGREAAVA